MNKGHFLLLLSSFLFASPSFWGFLFLLDAYYTFRIIPVAIELFFIPFFFFILVLLVYLFSKNIKLTTTLIGLQVLISLFLTFVLVSMAMPPISVISPRCQAECAGLTGQGNSSCTNAELSENCSGQCVWENNYCEYKEQPKPDYGWVLPFLLFLVPFIAGAVTLFIKVTQYNEK
jgi:hypothetical protein